MLETDRVRKGVFAAWPSAVCGMGARDVEHRQSEPLRRNLGPRHRRIHGGVFVGLCGQLSRCQRDVLLQVRLPGLCLDVCVRIPDSLRRGRKNKWSEKHRRCRAWSEASQWCFVPCLMLLILNSP